MFVGVFELLFERVWQLQCVKIEKQWKRTYLCLGGELGTQVAV
jgi:hypothetical protein